MATAIQESKPRFIPGKLTEQEGQALYAWTFERRVLQIGGYCGKGLIVVGKAASHVWLVDNFSSYPGGWDSVAGEIMAVVKGAEVDNKIDLLFYPSPLDIPIGELPHFDTVYIDANWEGQEAAMEWARRELPSGGRLIFHQDRDIRQVTF